MNIQHKEGPHRGLFFIKEEGEMKAEIVYSKNGDDTLVIEHTEVDDDLRGKKIGYELVQKTMEYAREQGLKVSPLCPFAKAIIDKKPEWQDLLV